VTISATFVVDVVDISPPPPPPVVVVVVVVAPKFPSTSSPALCKVITAAPNTSAVVPIITDFVVHEELLVALLFLPKLGFRRTFSCSEEDDNSGSRSSNALMMMI
jgi:hypothetical protein